MPRRPGRMQNINPGKRTTAAQGSKMSEAYTPGWDAKLGQDQHRDRIDQREAMGNKKTPFGRTTLRPAR
jgi:hypothetical protein